MDIYEQIEDFCHKHKIDKLHFFEVAAAHLIEAVEVHQKRLVEGQTPHDDLKIYKTFEDIIMLYENLTGNDWKPTDVRVGRDFNETDRRFLELGMLRTILNFKGKKINSFAYFRPEIEFTIEEMREVKLPEETVEIMLRQRRKQVAHKRGLR